MQTNPFVIPTEITDLVEQITARNRARFGHDAFRMEDEGGDEGAGGNEGGDEGSGGGDGNEGGDEGAAELGKVELEKLPKEVQALVKRYRKEAADASSKARTEAKTQAAKEAQDALMADIGKKLGFIKDDDKKMTPEEFQAKLAEESGKTTAAQSAAKQTQLELAVYRSASKAGGDPDALLDSRTFLEKIGTLDPSKNDFNTKVTDAIKDAVKNNSKLALRAGAGSSSSSVDHGAGGGDGTTRVVKPLDQAVSGYYNT